MSEIASKPNTGTNASLSQPAAKNGAGAEHDLLFASFFGGVLATGAIANPEENTTVASPIFANANPDADPNLDRDSDILASMQSVAAMMSANLGKGQKSKLSDEADKRIKDEQVRLDGHNIDTEEVVSANPMMIGPMPIQQQVGNSLPVAQTSAVMAKMAFEDEAVISHQHTNKAAFSKVEHSLHPSTGQSQLAALSSSLPRGIKPDEKAEANSASIDEIPKSEGDGKNIQPRSDGRLVMRQPAYQPAINQSGIANIESGGDSDATLINTDDGTQTESSDEFIRVASRQTEHVAGRMNGQMALGDSLSANAVRQMQAVGVSVGGQMSQQNNGQSSGQSSSQSGSFGPASTGMTNGDIMDMLDMAQDNWTEMLLQRVERGLAGGKDKIDFHLNPRNLGKMRISLIVQNDRTNVHIQTETAAAAQMLSDAEARLAQMMDASGLKFGNLTSHLSQNFAGNFSGQNSGQGRKGDASHVAGPDTEDGTNESNAEISVERSENLINLQA